jgi:hypothetical protein
LAITVSNIDLLSVDILVLTNTNGVLTQTSVKADVIDGIIKDLNIEDEEAEKEKENKK